MSGFNLHHSRPDAAAIKLDKQARNATTTTECQLQDAAFVPETSFEKGDPQVNDLAKELVRVALSNSVIRECASSRVNPRNGIDVTLQCVTGWRHCVTSQR